MGHGAPDKPAAAKPLPIPPRRGRVRKRYVGLLIVLLAIGWVGWKGYVIMSAKPGPLVDYTPQLIALSEKYQPKGENGWPVLMKALEHFDNIGVPDVEGWPTQERSAYDIIDGTHLHRGEFDGERLRLELAYFDLVQHSGVLEELDAALAAPKFVRTEFPGSDECLMYTEMPDLALCRRASMVRAVALRITAESGNWPEFVRSWTEQLRLAGAYSHDPILISHIVAQSTLVRAMEELNLLLTEHRLDASVSELLLASLENVEIAPFELPLEGERLVMYDLMQRCYSDDGHGDGVLLINSLEKFAETDRWSSMIGGQRRSVLNLVGLTYPRRAETRRTLDEFIDAAIRQSNTPRSSIEDGSSSIERVRDQLPERDIFLRLLFPAFDRALDRWYGAQAKIAATRILLAIEIYEARHGAPPTSIENLVPESLPSVPVDPICGRPFVYVVRTPTADDPREFLLYSVGVDCLDNEGVEPNSRTHDEALSARVMAELRDGYDYIFNRLREPVEEER